LGPKGSGQFERMSWDAALDENADRFQQIAACGLRQSCLAVIWGMRVSLNGLTVGDAFFNRLGATIANAPSASPAPALLDDLWSHRRLMFRHSKMHHSLGL